MEIAPGYLPGDTLDKKNEKTKIEYHRPASLLSVFSKVLERLFEKLPG